MICSDFEDRIPHLGILDVAYILGDSESCQLVIQKFFQGAYATWQIQASVLDINTVRSLWQTLTKSEHKSLLGNKVYSCNTELTISKAMPAVLLDPGKNWKHDYKTPSDYNWGRLLLSASPGHRQVGTAEIHCDPFMSIRQSSLI